MNIIEQGLEIRRQVVDDLVIDKIKQEVASSPGLSAKYGIRNADKRFHSIAALSTSSEFMMLAESTLGRRVEVVRVIFFDKTPENNWLVTWHQDKTIALKNKHAISGWRNWSLKDGTHHVQPTNDVLESMITFRLHLDPSDESNGCLKVMPGSHRHGVLTQSQIEQMVASEQPVNCTVQAGDLLIMKPLLLHASSKSVRPEHRRVVHIEYSYFSLPQGLAWA